MKKVILMVFALGMVSACTHQKVSVTEFGDKDKTCAQLKRDIEQMEELEKNIDSKTGMSGRNVGMALIFWPGILVNEINADDARDRAAERKEKLFDLYDGKNCS